MAGEIDRIEIYIDEGGKPFQVLAAPPFKLRLDTRHLAEGDHTLRVVTLYKGGAREERPIPFKVDNVPGVLIEGLDDGDVVRGDVDLEVKAGSYDLPASRPRRQAPLYLGSFFVVLGGVWGFFALTPPAGRLIAEMAPPNSTAQTGGQQSGQQQTPVDSAFYSAGKAAYAQYCVSCHQANGKGVDDSFPPLAGNTNLKDLGLVVKTVHEGKSGHTVIEGKSFNSTMPPIGSGFSDKEIAEVATYVRNSWGNDFGGVTIDEVKKYLGGGSDGGGEI